MQPSYKKGQKRKGFGEYLKSMGLAEKGHAPTQMTKEQALIEAEKTDALVRAAFRKPIVQA